MIEDKIKKPIVIDEYCEQQILNTFSQVRNYAIVYLIWCTFSFIRFSWKLIINIQKPSNNWVNIFGLKIYPGVYLLQIIITLLTIYYWKLAYKMQKDSIQISDSAMFANSYKIIRKVNVISLVTLIITIVSTVIAMYAESTI
jgi:hypothetical protein